MKYAVTVAPPLVGVKNYSELYAAYLRAVGEATDVFRHCVTERVERRGGCILGAIGTVGAGLEENGGVFGTEAGRGEQVTSHDGVCPGVFGVLEVDEVSETFRGGSVSGGERIEVGAGGGQNPTSGDSRKANVSSAGAGVETIDGEHVNHSGSCGPNWERNRAWKAEKKRKRDLKRVPQWRVGAAPLSPPSTVVTVDSRTAEEIEAARTLAVRRTFENKLAVVRTKHQLASYADKDKTEAIKRLEVARIEERINTTKAKSQASYKKCDTPLNSVGSAGSAGEFAWKQEIRKRDAVIKERDYYEQQLEVAMKFLPDAGKRAIAELPEPYIPTLEDIEFEDADISPYYSREEMEAEAAKWVGDEAW